MNDQEADDLPILILGPGETKYAHQPNEFVEIDDFYEMIEINQQMAEAFLSDAVK